MRNEFGGHCYKCGLWVEKGTGHFNRKNGKWRVHHALSHNRGKNAMSCEEAKKQHDIQKQKGVFDGLC